MTTRSFSYARKGKLSGGNCLTLIGTVGEEFQRRAKAEAIRQGYPADQITLECEQLSGGGRPAEEAMPLHLRRRLGHELSEPPPIKENAHDAEPTPSAP